MKPTIESLTVGHLRDVAKLHCESFSDPGINGQSIATLGPEFVSEVFYRSNLSNPHFRCDVAVLDGKVVAFSAYTTGAGGFRLISTRVLWQVLTLAMKHPSKLAKFIVANLTLAAPGVPSGAGWWLAAAVDAQHRRSGIGGELFRRMEQTLLEEGCSGWYGIVRPANAAICSLLASNGAEVVSQRRAQGIKMVYYWKPLTEWVTELGAGPEAVYLAK